MSIFRKRWVVVVIGILAALLALVAFAAYLLYPAFKVPSPPGFEPPATPEEARKQDLAYLQTALREVDRSFSAEEWRNFDQQVAALSAQAGTLDAATFEMGIARAVAAADNGHTNLLGAAWGLTLDSIPLRFYWFAEGLFTVKAAPEHADLLGARVRTIAGRTPEELVRSFRSFVGGNAALARELSIHLMESPGALRAIGVQSSTSSVELALETLTGDLVERTVEAVPTPVSGPPPESTEQTRTFDPRELYWPRRDASPVPLPIEAPYPQPTADGRPWVHVLDGRDAALGLPLSLPFSLQRPNHFYWATDLSGSGLFVQINVTFDQPGRESLPAFLDATLEQASTRRPRFAIVDLRGNPGGSYQATARFTRVLPTLLPADGKLFILTSGNTFSAGIVTAARLRHFSGDRGEIVGEPMGDTPQFWAEAATRIVLPGSGLRIGYATGYHDWENGCSLGQVLRCYLPNYFLGVAAGPLDPTIPVSWSFADYLEGRDTVVERALGMVAVE
jgi:hypothetical protein